MSPHCLVVPTRDAPHAPHLAYTDAVSHTFPSFGDCARAWLQEREAEAQSGELAYHTIVSYRRTVRVLIEALGSIIVNEVGREHLRKMHGDNRGRPTVANQALNIARRILRDAE